MKKGNVVIVGLVLVGLCTGRMVQKSFPDKLEYLENVSVIFEFFFFKWKILQKNK